MLSIHPEDSLLDSEDLQNELVEKVIACFGENVSVDELKLYILDDMQTFRMVGASKTVDVKLSRRLKVDQENVPAPPRDYLKKHCSKRSDYDPNLPLNPKKNIFSYL